jgi:acetyl-CoA carboxylase alpha subunit
MFGSVKLRGTALHSLAIIDGIIDGKIESARRASKNQTKKLRR